MSNIEQIDCIESLLDILSYEKETGRLSCEMEGILETHLASCPGCRARADDFLGVLNKIEEISNFG